MIMHTVSGQGFPLTNPTAKDISIDTIALALSRIPRFGGHTAPGREWSVAAHSLLVTAFLQMDGAPTGVQLMGLLHDAHEAYIGDIPGPVYAVLRQAGQTEAIEQMRRSIDVAVAQVAGLPDPRSNVSRRFEHAVKKADLEALSYERFHFLRPQVGNFWQRTVDLPPAKMLVNLHFDPAGPAAAAAFAKKYDLLTSAIQHRPDLSGFFKP